MIPEAAVEAVMIAWLDRSKAPGSWSLEEEVRAALKAAAPHMLAAAWDAAYQAALEDEGLNRATTRNPYDRPTP